MLLHGGWETRPAVRPIREADREADAGHSIPLAAMGNYQQVGSVQWRWCGFFFRLEPVNATTLLLALAGHGPSPTNRAEKPLVRWPGAVPCVFR